MMKNVILILSFFVGVTLTTQAQETVNALPYSNDLKQLPDGWHKFTLQGASFDVEVIGGRLVQGNVSWFDGAKYSGSLGGSVISGRGTYTWPDGTRYEGSFKNNARHGKGSMIQLDGSKWSGKWKNNQKNGKGKMFDAEGAIVQKGVWVSDEYIGAKKK